MKKIGFIGAFEKTDLIIYVAKVLTELGQRVLIIDTTVLEKARYIVPAITPTKFYVTEYEKIDIAVGFKELISLNKYLDNIEDNYDIIIVDIDSADTFSNFEMTSSDKLYFVTAFDNYSLKKGIEIVSNIITKVKMTKILFEREVVPENDEYLNLLSMTSPIEWAEEKIYFPYDQGDLTAIIENQRVAKIKFKNLSEQYREGITILVEEILPEVKFSNVKKIIKNI